MKQTKIFRMSAEKIDYNAINECADIIKNGGTVVFPTETVYGIGCDAFNANAIQRIYDIKRRPKDKPLLAHLYSITQAEQIANLNALSRKLLKLYTPGPLTLIVGKKDIVPDIMTAGGNTVGLRFPSDAVGLAFMQACGVPLAATSANLSGLEASVTGEEAASSLIGLVDAVIDSGKTSLGTPSTIISLDGEPRVIRYGSFDETELNKILHPNIKRIGVCGRSGSGKGVFTSFLCGDDVVVVDTDAVYHEMTSKTDSECARALADVFGNEILDGQGRLNRSALREIVFADEDKRRILNRISHAYVINAVDEIALEAALDGKKAVFIDAPLLFESGIDKTCDAVICVAADDESCIKRITERDNIEAAEAEKRLALQPDYSARSTYTVINNGTVEALKQKALELKNTILRED